jgi:hypothetical protein
MDIVKAAERAKVIPDCTCAEVVGFPANAKVGDWHTAIDADPNCPIHGAHFSDADVDDEPIE